MVWGWISAEYADEPPVPKPDLDPPTAAEAALLVNRAWAISPDWGSLVWTKMTTGVRRGEICGFRWTHLELDDTEAVATIRRTVYVDADGNIQEKDTKTHQQRRVVLDPETIEVLLDHRDRAKERARTGGYTWSANAFVFSPLPDGRPVLPDTITQKYDRMAKKLGIETKLRNLHHYNATELILAGVDARTVGGRLGHGGGGSTTLRVYTAWTSEADQRAAKTITGRMPARPNSEARQPRTPSRVQSDDALTLENELPYQRIAADLRGAIQSGILISGTHSPLRRPSPPDTVWRRALPIVPCRFW